MKWKVVDATTDDAHVIGQIQTQTWLCNYPNPKMGITKEDIKEKTDLWEKLGDDRIIKHLQDPSLNNWVAKNNDVVVGFVAAKKSLDRNQIAALHVLPEFQGQGIGTELLKTALDWLGNSKKITIDVVSYNEGAKRLYKKFGFKEAGEAKDDPIILPNGKIISKILMVKFS